MPEPIAGGASTLAAYVQTATGAVLLTTPFWAQLLYTVNIIAATIASICGAVVGLTGLWRIVRGHKGEP
jgi:hypothetical protein